MPVQFFEDDISAKLRSRRALSQFLQQEVRLLRPELKKINLTYIFCSDEKLLDINQQFLQHDTYTDIITFDLSPDNTMLEGEIYISADRVADNARHFSRTYNDELHRVIFHGALHLCGLKDKSKADAERMRAAEDRWLDAYFAKQPS